MSADTDMVKRVAHALAASDGIITDCAGMARYVRLARAALDASGIGEMVEAGRALAAKIDALADAHCGPFAIRNAVANSQEMIDFRAALSRAALQSLGYAEMERENTATITEWATTTFGDTGGHPRRAARANEEMAELLRAVVSGEDDDRLAEEAADVAIVLHLFAGRLGRDLTAEIDKKMKRNRARKWAVDATGCGYHVQEAAE